jgi:hypothetical protein
MLVIYAINMSFSCNKFKFESDTCVSGAVGREIQPFRKSFDLIMQCCRPQGNVRKISIE